MRHTLSALALLLVVLPFPVKVEADEELIHANT